MGTRFVDVYDRFFGKITDDMYLEYTPLDTLRDLRSLILDAIPGFEFPRKKMSYILDSKIFDGVPEDSNDNVFYWEAISNAQQKLKQIRNSGLKELEVGSEFWNGEEDGSSSDSEINVDTSSFDETLSDEEINILAVLMVKAWVQRQITSIENTRMKYSGSDFKMTSQANHLSKLLSLMTEMTRQSHYLQRLYKRRKTDDNGYIQSNWSILREKNAIDY